jgi:hypothetical protein
MRAGQSQTPGIRGLKGYTRLSALATPWKAIVRTCTSNVFGSTRRQIIAAHPKSDDTLTRLNGAWLIKEMKAAVVPDL